jgi:hypothetical protein
MASVRDHWLEAVTLCVTVVLVGMAYTVMARYVAGPPVTVHTSALHVSSVQNASGPSLR